MNVVAADMASPSVSSSPYPSSRANSRSSSTVAGWLAARVVTVSRLCGLGSGGSSLNGVIHFEFNLSTPNDIAPVLLLLLLDLRH